MPKPHRRQATWAPRVSIAPSLALPWPPTAQEMEQREIIIRFELAAAVIIMSCLQLYADEDLLVPMVLYFR